MKTDLEDILKLFTPKVLWGIILILLFVVVLCSVEWWHQIKTEQQLTTETEQVRNNPATDWKTYVSAKHGFEFKYPANWNSSPIDNDWARVINPVRSGKMDTDNPIEQFIVFILDTPCVPDSAWKKGFGDIYYKSSCKVVGKDFVNFGLSAYDESSMKIMDQILSTFKFTE